MSEVIKLDEPSAPPAVRSVTHIASLSYLRVGPMRVESRVSSLCGDPVVKGERLLNRKALRDLTFQSKYDLNLCPRCEARAS